MSSKKAIVALAALSLLISMSGTAGGASESPPQKHSTVRTNSDQDRTRSDDVEPNCEALSVVALTPSVSSFRNKVEFQVNVPPLCMWSATSDLIQEITPAQGEGTQYVTVIGTLPPNNNDQGRTATLSVTSTNGAVVRMATVTQAGAVFDCTGVDVHPTTLWVPGGFIYVNVPAGWTWYWQGVTPLMTYNCTPQYPTGVNCYWPCTNIEPRVGYGQVVARGEGHRCLAGVSGNQTWCPPTSTPTPRPTATPASLVAPGSRR